MGHKVHPIGFRLGIVQDWQAKWYADAHYAEFLREDVKLRKAIDSKYREAAISLVEIDRQAKDVTVTLYTARPGIVIGRGGQRVDEMRLYLEGLTGKRVRLNVQEIRQPELDAYLVARSIADQLGRRIAYRRAIKQAAFRTIQAGAKGVRISCSGRLGDSEIARRHTMHEGQVPLHTLRADIDYGFTEAHTTMGQIGVKVWIYKGIILPEAKVAEVEEAPISAGVEEKAEAEAAVQPEEKPGKLVADEDVEEAVAAKVEEPLAEDVGEAVVTDEVEEKPGESVAEVIAETASAEKPEEKPAKPRARKTEKAAVSAEPEKKPTKPRARKTEKAAASTETEEKPTKPRARKTEKAAVSTEPEEKPAKPRARKTEKAAVSTEPEEKPAKTATKKRKKIATAEEPEGKITGPAAEPAVEAKPATLIEDEESDGTAT